MFPLVKGREHLSSYLLAFETGKVSLHLSVAKSKRRTQVYTDNSRHFNQQGFMYKTTYIYINIYIYRESASRFSRGTVLNTLKQSRINIVRGKKDASLFRESLHSSGV